MKNSKKRGTFGVGRKFALTLALFLLVFAAASAVKIHAGTNDSGQGWLWSGGAGPNDGTNTNVGWISINNTNQNGATNYGVNIPSSNGDVTGYAWSENIGWISFNAADTAGCPQNPCGAVRVVGNNIKGWARILGIRDALAAGNSGGWQGWISLSGPQYGVKINADNTLTGFGWSDELGWIDFSRAKYTEPCTPSCGTAVGTTYCSGDTPNPANLCVSGCGAATPVIGSGPWSWSCAEGSNSVPCTTGPITPAQPGQCGTADGGAFCQGRTPTDVELCSGGKPNPAVASLNLESYEVTWNCTGICSTVNDSCSAKGKKACGWIETNP